MFVFLCVLSHNLISKATDQENLLFQFETLYLAFLPILEEK